MFSLVTTVQDPLIRAIGPARVTCPSPSYLASSALIGQAWAPGSALSGRRAPWEHPELGVLGSGGNSGLSSCLRGDECSVAKNSTCPLQQRREHPRPARRREGRAFGRRWEPWVFLSHELCEPE